MEGIEGAASGTADVALEDLSGGGASRLSSEDDEDNHTAGELEAVFDVPVNVSAVLGKSYLQISQLMKLAPGAVLELDRKVGEAIDIYVNNRLVARGEVVLVDERLGVTMTEIIKGDGQ
ncbi:MAG: flagellar motor switch protein FliN [Sphingomonadales bacterium]|nr:flagellar motor switch protein FliN [Sphingomonadales bacterium]